MKVRLFIFVVVSILLGGCARSGPMLPSAMDVSAKRFEKPRTGSRIYIYVVDEVHNFLAPMGAMPMTVNGVEAGRIGPLQYLMLDVPTGSYVIKTIASDDAGAIVSASRNDLHFVRFRRRWGEWNTEEVSPVIGKNEIRKRRRANAQFFAQASEVEHSPEGGVSSGTGFIVSRKGEIVTNQHVVEKCLEITAVVAGKVTDATLVRKDSINDLALLKVSGVSVDPLSFRSSNRLLSGESVVALGFPLAGVLSHETHVTTGIITALAGINDDTRFLQTSAPVQPGNSGGPLLDSAGNVIGVITSKLNALKALEETGDLPQNVNFALKSGIVKGFLDSNDVDYRNNSDQRSVKVPELVSRSKPSLVYIECKH